MTIVTAKGQLIAKNKFQLPTTKAELSERKLTLCVWWDHSRIIHFQVFNRNPTLNALASMCARTSSKKTPLHSSLGEILYFSLITQGYIQKESLEEIFNSGWSFLPSCEYFQPPLKS